MRKTDIREFRNYRYYILAILTTMSMILLFGEEPDTIPAGDFIKMFLINKSVGILLGYIVYRLCDYWSRRNKIPYIQEKMK